MTTCSCGQSDVHEVSRRYTFDGVDVRLSSDGSVSSRQTILRGKLPVDRMWQVWGDVGLYTWDELPEVIRSVKRGKFQPFRVRKPIDHEAIMASNEQERMRRLRVEIENNRNPWKGIPS